MFARGYPFYRSGFVVVGYIRRLIQLLWLQSLAFAQSDLTNWILSYSRFLSREILLILPNKTVGLASSALSAACH